MHTIESLTSDNIITNEQERRDWQRLLDLSPDEFQKTANTVTKYRAGRPPITKAAPPSVPAKIDHKRERAPSETRTWDGLFVKAATEEQTRMRRRRFVASTESIDSHDELVLQEWNLERYLKNPVVLWAHRRDLPPIGKAVAIEMVGGKLEVEVEFAPESANPQAEQIWQLVCGGFVRAVSVGFWPNDVRFELRDGREICVLGRNDLYEVSVLPLGSNEDALAKSAARSGPRSPRDPSNEDDGESLETLLGLNDEIDDEDLHEKEVDRIFSDDEDEDDDDDGTDLADALGMNDEVDEEDDVA